MKRRILNQSGRTLNRMVEDALRFVSKLHDLGKIPFRWMSGFLLRDVREDIVETMLILEADVHEMVRNYAFAYRISMAEVLRVALEVYLDHLESEDGKLDDTLHYYDPPVSVISTVLARLIPAFHNGIPPDHYNIICRT